MIASTIPIRVRNQGIAKIGIVVVEGPQCLPNRFNVLNQKLLGCYDAFDDLSQLELANPVTALQNLYDLTQCDLIDVTRVFRAQRTLNESRRGRRLLSVILNEIANHHIGIQTNQMAPPFSRIASSICFNVTAFAGFGTIPLSDLTSRVAATI